MRAFRSLLSGASPFWLIAGILLIAANLRAPVTGVAPLLDLLRDHFHLSAGAAGLLTTLPLLGFALMSPAAARLGQRHGLGQTLFVAMLVLFTGILLRSSGPLIALFAGTALIGGAIAVGNVLLPALVKRDFPDHVTTLTAAYALTMGIAAGLVSAVASPLSGLGHNGWDIALASSAVLVWVTLLVWWPQVRAQARTAPPAHTAAPLAKSLWRYALAWQVTLFFGLNSLVYYVIISWLPAMLHEAGFSAARTGTLHGVLQIASALPGLVLIPLLRQREDLRGAAVAVTLLALIGLAGLLLAPAWSLLWCIAYGFGAGAGIILALAFVSLRSASVGTAAALSGMAQCLGYLLAASGPVLTGLLHDASGSWAPILWLCMGCATIQAVLGLYAGGARRLGD